MWKQLIDANWRVPYIGGWCLKYVQDAFGTDHPYPSAMAAWNANYGNGNHPGEQPPVGKTVPVYFTLGNVPEGHVAISLDDGTIASSTQAGSHPQGYIHPNMQSMINMYAQYNGGCSYLGWSEFVGTKQVLGLSPVTATAAQVQQAYLDILERPADAGGLQHYTTNGMTNDQVRADLLASAEHARLIAKQEAQAVADREAQAHAEEVAKAQADAQAQVDAKAQQEAAKAAQDAKAKADAINAQDAPQIAVAQPVQNTVEDEAIKVVTSKSFWRKLYLFLLGFIKEIK